MIVAYDVIVTSTYEHHFITIHGTENIEYTSHHKIVLLKINRIVQFYFKRLKIQERLTK
jgi:GTP cyclohydrolase I